MAPFFGIFCFLGDVTFKSDPSVDYLNGQSFYDLLTVAWFVDDAYINFDVDEIRFEQVTLKQSTTLTVCAFRIAFDFNFIDRNLFSLLAFKGQSERTGFG